jgi:hypothetical protein
VRRWEGKRSAALEERPGGLEVKGERKVLRDFGIRKAEGGKKEGGKVGRSKEKEVRL